METSRSKGPKQMGYAVHKWTEIDKLMIGYSTEGPIHEDVWAQFVHDLKTRPIKKYLGMSIGNLEVTSLQRKQVADALKGRGVALAIVTDEKLVRGIVTAASWLGMDVKSFSMADLRLALRHLDVPSHMEDRAIEVVRKLKKTCEDERRRLGG